MAKIVKKVVLLGDPAVGKSSLIRRFVKGSFESSYQATIGTNILAKEVKVSNELTILLQVWDIAGHIRLVDVNSAHFRGAAGAGG